MGDARGPGEAGARTTPRSPRLAGALLLLVVVLAAGLRFADLGRRSLWFDEAVTWKYAEKPLARLWGAEAAAESNPPFFYTLEHVCVRLFGDSETALRSLPALFGLATICLVGALGRAAFDDRVGVLAAALLALSGVHILYSQNARAYTLLTAAGTLAALGVVKLLEQETPHAAPAGERPSAWRAATAWAAYVGGAILALWAHNVGVLLPVLATAAVVPFWWGRLGRSPRLAGEWVAANAVALGAWVWWLPIEFHQAASGIQTIDWMPEPSFHRVLSTLRYAYGQPYAPLQPAADGVLALLALWGAWRWRHRAGAAVVLVLAAGVPAATLAVSFWRPVFIERVLTWGAPMFTLLLAAGALALPRPGRRVAVPALLVLFAVGAWKHHREPAPEPWREVVDYVRERAQPGDAVLLLPSYTDVAYRYYARRAPHPDVYRLKWSGGDLQVLPVPGGPPRPLESSGELPASYRRYWLISRFEDGRGPTAAALSEVATAEPARDFAALQVTLFLRREPAATGAP
jgi:4-amino-4-deoxy-L-arabinose transferase-like glycosyltransferase